MGIVEVEGARLRYVSEGRGVPVLVIGSSVYYPRMFSQELREHLQLVFVDLRHFATSDPEFNADSVTRETYADDIEHVRRTLELGDVFVMGHSLAGSIALEYARRYPEHVRGVIAVGGHAYRTDEEPGPADRLWEADASEDRKQILARNFAELTPEVMEGLSPAEQYVRRYDANAPKAWYDPNYDGAWLWEGVVLNMALLNRVYGELFKHYDLTQEQPDIGVPVLIVHGRYDYLVAHTVWDDRRHKLARHTYALMEESAHSPPLEEPERFDAIVLDWVQGLQEPPRS
jgi:proline iminopeptidase